VSDGEALLNPETLGSSGHLDASRPARVASGMIRWAWVVLFTLFIYATLPVGRQAWSWFVGASRFWSDNIALAGLVLGGAGIAWLAARRPNPSARSWAIAASVAAIYALSLRLLQLTPAEKTHFLYYGFLAYLAHRALRQHSAGVALHVATIALVAGIGLGDELIQHVLPRRFFEWKDVFLNALSGALALALVVQFEPEVSVFRGTDE